MYKNGLTQSDRTGKYKMKRFEKQFFRRICFRFLHQERSTLKVHPPKKQTALNVCVHFNYSNLRRMPSSLFGWIVVGSNGVRDSVESGLSSWCSRNGHQRMRQIFARLADTRPIQLHLGQISTSQETREFIIIINYI